ncbi:aminoglycoside 3-N-acetyltransferase [Sphingomonas corticis]|jgi:aminoglycoside 3-N-acetyltransferase|uniref:Aminoglycoside N(3)-acetyltransferase n=1 Tax=Sphingomonas corticis TaxID=2722791 RepID=A0ABX1CLN4_9SPHN|nr:aminoglycoside 3-N-acetyltransferase [Sphingomonas corticis]NJR77015.1 aminoglycoside 3-N-acetyltransferase [Sphingomonas corticis]
MTPTTRAALAADLSQLGLHPGDTVMAHAGMRSVGPLLNGPDALIGAIRDVIGEAGTLMAYVGWDTLHDDLLDGDGCVLPAWREHVPGFDPAASRATRLNGAFAEFVRTTPGAVRSANPGMSMAAIGAKAAWLTADHPQDYGCGEGSPLAKLVEAGGRVLMVGAPHDTCTLLHLAEHRARVPGKRILSYEVPFAEPGGVRWRRIEEFDTSEPCVDGMPEDLFQRIVDAYLATGEGWRGPVGQAQATLVDAGPLLAFAIAAIERDHGALDAGAAEQ